MSFTNATWECGVRNRHQIEYRCTIRKATLALLGRKRIIEILQQTRTVGEIRQHNRSRIVGNCRARFAQLYRYRTLTHLVSEPHIVRTRACSAVLVVLSV